MNTRMWSWLALPIMLFLSGCPDGGGGGLGFENVPLALQAYLKASNTDSLDNFGRMVAIDGDTLVIGVPDEDSAGVGVNSGQEADDTASGSGAVYVFVLNNGNWSQQAYIKASNTGAGDAFGTSVAISGNTLVVGAPHEDSSLTTVLHSPSPTNEAATGNETLESGAVYVFTRSGTAWSQQAYVKASNTGAADSFGSSVAISGDTLVVGATGEDSDLTGVTAGSPNEATTGNGASGSGAVYVFTRAAGVWSQQAYIKASNTQADDAFGASVAISSDTVVVGATGEDSNATGIGGDEANDTELGSGAVYVFVRSGGIWSQQAYIKASNTQADDAFGASIAISSDTLVVGATGEDSNFTGVTAVPPDNATTGDVASNSGAVYVFTRSVTTWTQQAYIKASNTQADDAFGADVSISGNILAVGAPGEDGSLTTVLQGSPNNLTTGDGETDAGAAYTFINPGGGWSQQAYVKASNAETLDAFGTSVSISGDTLVVGATGEASNATGVGGNQTDNNASSSGAAYVFR